MVINMEEIAKLVDRITKKSIFRRRFARLNIELIKKRTQKGRGVTNDRARSHKSERLKDVSAAYAKLRRRVKNKGSPFPVGRKSNATLTGQMLDAMAFKLSANGKGWRIFIKHTKRRPIKVKALRTERSKKDFSIKTRQTNNDVAFWYGIERPFLALTTREQAVMVKAMDKKLQKELNKIKTFIIT